MLDFDLYNPTHIVFGKDRLATLNDLVPAKAKVLITFGGGSAKKSGLLDKVKKNLGSRTVLEFGGIEPNPQYNTLMKAVEIVRQEKIDFILAVGGGSVLDGTKFITIAAYYPEDPTKLLHYFNVPEEIIPQAVPFGSILTLPATGSEMNCGAVISHEHAKYPVMCGLSYPKFSLLDPTLTFTLPKIQVANGIVDTFVHTTEQYLTFPVNGLIQDRFAESILQTMLEIGIASIEGSDNYEVRANHMWCSTLALNGLIGAGVPQDWATHMIGHEITALCGIDHGQTLAIVLPALLEVQRKPKFAKLLQYAERVWKLTTGTDDEKVDLAIQKTREFFESLGIKTRLSQYGVTADKIAVLVQQLKDHGMTALSETGEITPEVSQKILEKAF